MTDPRALIQAPVTTIKAEEPRAILTIEKHKISFLIDTGASISAIPFFPEQRSSKKLHTRPASRALFHSASSLLLRRIPLLSFPFNCTRNCFSSARARPSI
jgi:hypothetical protein